MLKKNYWNSLKSENCIIPSYYNNYNNNNNNNNTNDLIRQRYPNQELTNYGAAGQHYWQSQTKAPAVSVSSHTIPYNGNPSSFYGPPQQVYNSYVSGPATTVLYMEPPAKKTHCVSLCTAFVLICILLISVSAWMHFSGEVPKLPMKLNTIKKIVISTSMDDDYESILEDVGA